MAKKFRSLVTGSVLEPKLVLPSALEPSPAATSLTANQSRHKPAPAFTVHDRKNAQQVMSFASRRRNH